LEFAKIELVKKVRETW